MRRRKPRVLQYADLLTWEEDRFSKPWLPFGAWSSELWLQFIREGHYTGQTFSLAKH